MSLFDYSRDNKTPRIRLFKKSIPLNTKRNLTLERKDNYLLVERDSNYKVRYKYYELHLFLKLPFKKQYDRLINYHSFDTTY